MTPNINIGNSRMWNGPERPVYIKLIAVLLACVVLHSSSLCQDLQWAKQLAGKSWDEGIDVTTDRYGNVYSIGNFDDTLDLDPGPASFNLIPKGRHDVFICKLDPSGNLTWGRQIGGAGWESTTGVAVDRHGNIYITGRFLGISDFDPGPGSFILTSSSSTDAFVCKLDSSGNFQWACKFSQTASSAVFPYPVLSEGIAVDDSGNVYTAGSFDGPTDFDPGPGVFVLTPKTLRGSYTTDIFISKLDAAGNFIWAKHLGGTNFEGALAIAVDKYRNICITGFFNGEVDFDPGPGIFNLATAGQSETRAFVAKLDAAGNFAWAKNLGGDRSYAVAADNTGNLYVGAAGYHSWNGITLQKFHPDGNSAWLKELMVPACNAIAIDNNNNVYTTGPFFGTRDFDPGPGSFYLHGGNSDSYISKLDSAGNFIWAKQIGGTQQVLSQSLALDRNNNIYTLGDFSATADFDPGTANVYLTAAGSYDVFIQKLKQDNVPSNTGLNPSINIYPNPTRGKFIIEFKDGFKCSYIILRNVLGQLLVKKVVTDPDYVQIEIVAPSATYFLEVYDQKGQRVVTRIVKY